MESIRAKINLQRSLQIYLAYLLLIPHYNEEVVFRVQQFPGRLVDVIHRQRLYDLWKPVEIIEAEVVDLHIGKVGGYLAVGGELQREAADEIILAILKLFFAYPLFSYRPDLTERLLNCLAGRLVFCLKADLEGAGVFEGIKVAVD